MTHGPLVHQSRPEPGPDATSTRTPHSQIKQPPVCVADRGPDCCHPGRNMCAGCHWADCQRAPSLFISVTEIQSATLEKTALRYTGVLSTSSFLKDTQKKASAISPVTAARGRGSPSSVHPSSIAWELARKADAQVHPRPAESDAPQSCFAPSVRAVKHALWEPLPELSDTLSAAQGPAMATVTPDVTKHAFFKGQEL